MAVGLATLATSWLNTIRGGGNGVTYTAPAALYVKLHTADPGAAATNAPSAVTTRQAITFGAPSAGAIAISNAPAFSMTGAETITHISVWDNVSAGNLLWTAALTTSRTVANGDTLTLTGATVSLTPLAA